MKRPIFTADGDGVLFDYSTAYARAWERAFGRHPLERDPTAYWPLDRWEVERLSGDRLERFRAAFDTDFLTTIPALDGAVEAAHALHNAGFEVVCVTAIKRQYEAARLKNLRAHGFPIDRVIATGSEHSLVSPKAAALAELDPVAFVDDLLPYLRGLKPSIHKALVIGPPNGSPNVGSDLATVDSQHRDFQSCVRWWLSRDR